MLRSTVRLHAMTTARQGEPAPCSRQGEPCDNPASSERLDAIRTRNARRAVDLIQAPIEASRSHFIANYYSPRKQATD
jgi:hypothetical protein